jgi:hypothetical protein
MYDELTPRRRERAVAYLLDHTEPTVWSEVVAYLGDDLSARNPRWLDMTFDVGVEARNCLRDGGFRLSSSDLDQNWIPLMAEALSRALRRSSGGEAGR